MREEKMNSLNNLFNSENVDDLCRFYTSLKDTEDLVEFCEWRKNNSGKPEIYVHNEDSPSETVVIVLTPRVDDKYALNCRSIFPDCPILFVHGRSPYFNESQYFNAGIREALSFDPHWIVLSSDDVYKLDDATMLTEGLSRLDHRQVDQVWISPKPDYYHSYDAYITSRLIVEKIYHSIRGSYYSAIDKFYDKFSIKHIVLPVRPITKPIRYYLYHTLFPAILYRRILRLRMTSDFAVLSSEFLKTQPNGRLLNDLFVTQEDIDLSLRLLHARSVTVDYRVGSYIGGHYAVGMRKAMKEILNLALFNYLARNGEYPEIGES